MTCASSSLLSQIESAELTPSLRDRLHNAFAVARAWLRRHPSYVELPRAPWLLFDALAGCWRKNARAYPSQAWLGRQLGYGERTIRDATRVLELRGLIRVEREMQPDGHRRIYYLPGPLTVQAIRDFTTCDRPTRKGPMDRHARPGSPAAIAVTPPATTAGESEKHQDLNLPSEANAPPIDPRPVAEGEEVATPGIAKAVLAKHWMRKHPEARVPRWWDASKLAMVVACLETLRGSPEEMDRSIDLALEGAWALSHGRAPSVGYVFGSVDYFLDHVARGRAILQAGQRKATAVYRSRELSMVSDDALSTSDIAASVDRLLQALT